MWSLVIVTTTHKLQVTSRLVLRRILHITSELAKVLECAVLYALCHHVAELGTNQGLLATGRPLALSS